MIPLCLFFAPVWALEESCSQQNFIDKSRERHPKYDINCNKDTQVEDRWRGELIYEKLDGDTGIKIKWELLVQKPDCPSELKFYLNDHELKSISPQKSKTHKSDWIELTAMENFELKVQAHYYTDPKCFEATKAITLKNNTDLAYNIGNAEAINDNEKHGKIIQDPPESGTSTPSIVFEEDKLPFTPLGPVILPAFNENGTRKKDENGTVMMEEETTKEVITTTNSPAPENMIRNNASKIDSAADNDDNDDSTIAIAVACSVTATLVIIILVVGAIIWRKRCKSSAANEQEDIDENRVYGIYSDDADDDDYIVMQDTCPDYEPADVI